MKGNIIGQAVLQSYLSLGYFMNSLARTICLTLVILAIPIQTAAAENLPVINIHSSNDMSLEDEYQFGNIIASSIRKQLPF